LVSKQHYAEENDGEGRNVKNKNTFALEFSHLVGAHSIVYTEQGKSYEADKEDVVHNSALQ